MLLSVPIRFREQDWGAWQEKKRTLWEQGKSHNQANSDFLALLSFLLFRFVYYLFLDFGIVFCQQQDQDRWQNARWKNHEVMSWRDIKLQWWASISCFPFDLGFCIWFDNHFDHHWIVLEGTCGRALEGGITRQQLKWDEGEGCGHKVY